MRTWRPALWLSLALGVTALTLPVAQRVVEASPDPDADPLDVVASATVTVLQWWDDPRTLVCAGLLALGAGCGLVLRTSPRRQALALTPSLLAAALPLLLLRDGLTIGSGAWLMTGATMLLLWQMLLLLSSQSGWPRRLAVPALFGSAAVYGWEVLVRGFSVPLVLLPPPSLVAAALASQAAVLEADFVQTILRSALRGYVIGCAAGFALAVVCDRFPALGRGLLPYGTLASAVPMVGIAPIMIMWFGFGWQSKAAVVVVTTLFPMLVNTLAGLAQSERIQLDLMRSYGAGYWRTLVLLRLPNALPFIFNALKVNSTFALISAIVAEFFGTPITGMGFRIATDVARMDLSMVWATIVVAALTGSAAYGGLALIERSVTSWHPSYAKR